MPIGTLACLNNGTNAGAHSTELVIIKDDLLKYDGNQEISFKSDFSDLFILEEDLIGEVYRNIKSNLNKEGLV